MYPGSVKRVMDVAILFMKLASMAASIVYPNEQKRNYQACRYHGKYREQNNPTRTRLPKPEYL